MTNDNSRYRIQMEEDIKALPNVYGTNWDKTVEEEIRATPALPHIFVRKYTDLRRGRKKPR